MKIKIFILLNIIGLVFSQCKLNGGIQNTLSVDCYWDIFEKNLEHPINSCYKFDSNGNCHFYYYNFFNMQKTDSVFLYDDGDVIVSNKWELKEDSNLIVRGTQYQVLKYDADSVFLKGRRNDTVVLIKNCNTSNRKER